MEYGICFEELTVGFSIRSDIADGTTAWGMAVAVTINPYHEGQRNALVALSLRAWAPVFAKLEPAVASYVYEAFYPRGWDVRQTSEIEAFLDSSPDDVWMASDEGQIVGWVGLRSHPEDSMGEIYILAVDPDAQRRGVARALMETAFEQFRNKEYKMVMVETGDDPGHAPSRATYESVGFERWPVARYFREM